MSDKDDDLDEEVVWDAAVFNVDNVHWKVLPTRKRNEFTIKFYDDDGHDFSLLKVLFSLQKLEAQIEQELNIMEASDVQ